MKLIQLRLKNFRCYQEETTIAFDDFTAIIGVNDVGKSAILDALDIFFENIKLDKDDASLNGNRSEVIIACTFSNIPELAVIDELHPTSFLDEHLLNDQGHLEIVKSYNGAIGTPSLRETSARAYHPTRDGVSDLLQLTIAKLRTRANSLAVDLTDVDENKKAPIRSAIREQVGELECRVTNVPLDKEDAKQI